MSASTTEYFAHRKRQCEEQLRAIETLGIGTFQVTGGGSQHDTTEAYKEQLLDHCEAYQKAIDFIEGKLSTPILASISPTT